MGLVYKVAKQDLDKVETAFTYHPPIDDQPERYVFLRTAAKNLATEIMENCPASRERAVAITKLEEAIMWANASIARNEPNSQPKKEVVEVTDLPVSE